MTNFIQKIRTWLVWALALDNLAPAAIPESSAIPSGTSDRNLKSPLVGREGNPPIGVPLPADRPVPYLAQLYALEHDLILMRLPVDDLAVVGVALETKQ